MVSVQLSFGVLLSLILVSSCSGRQTFNIFWNSSNPMFRIDNTDHVFTAKIRDGLNIHCPLYNDTVLEEQTEQTIIYKVSKFGYDNCVLDDATPVGMCRSPYVSSPITVVLRQFTPSPGMLEFIPGKSHYFISTSTGTKDGAKNEKGGLCLEKNLRMRFDVLPTRSVPASPVVPEGKTGPESPKLNPRWKVKISGARKSEEKPVPSPAGEPDLNEFFQKLNQERNQGVDPSAPLNEGPNWWNPNSAPEEDFGAPLSSNSLPLYEIHNQARENEEQLVNSRYWPPMSDDGRAGRSDIPPTREQLVLYEIEEVDPHRNFMNSGTAVSVRWVLVAGCLVSVLLSLFVFLISE